MKNALITGDLTSDRAGEQYPTVAVCDDCIRTEAAKKEHSRILTIIGDEDDAEGPCEFCDCEE